MKPPIGRCSLCLEDGKELQNSHAIPNAVFKTILAANQGSGIAISQDIGVPTKYSGDSWKEYRLCRVCESTLNTAYEDKAIQVIRRDRKFSHYCEDGLSISKIELGRLRSFFVSVFWRASVWQHEAYRHFHLPEPLSEDIRRKLVSGSVIPARLMGVRLYVLRDAHFGFPEAEPFQQIVCNPFHRNTPDGNLIVSAFGGFLIEAKMGGYRGKDRLGKGVLRDGDRAVIAPWRDFSSVPELLELGVISYHKEKIGNTKLKGKDLGE